MRDHRSVPPALQPKSVPPIQRLAFRPREAAESLGLCERTLRNLPDVPRVKLGAAILYPVDLLVEWLRDRAHNSEAAGDAVSVSPVNGDTEGQGQ